MRGFLITLYFAQKSLKIVKIIPRNADDNTIKYFAVNYKVVTLLFRVCARATSQLATYTSQDGWS